MGVFHPFIEDKDVALIGVEAGGNSSMDVGGASINDGSQGVLHGAKTKILKQILAIFWKQIQSQQALIILVSAQNMPT